MAIARKSKKQMSGAANASFEAQLWAAADALRNNMDAAEYKHVVLGLIFLKYISDAFEAKHKELEAQKKQGADPEDPDEYRGSSIFWVPKEARWTHLKAKAPQPNIGTLVDEAMAAIERDNPTLKGVLPKDFGRVGLDKQRLGQIINLVSDIALGDEASKAKDTLGRVVVKQCADFTEERLWLAERLGKLSASERPHAVILARVRVSTEVLELTGAVITDCNAASDYVRFLAPSQWKVLDFDDIYAADSRRQGDSPRFYQHRSRKYAEVLVPDRVEPRFLTGAYVVDTEAADRLKDLGFDLPVDVKPVLFFRE